MAHNRVIVELPMDTTVSRDKAVNVWHFAVSAFDAATLDAIRDALDAFYTGVSSHLSSLINPNAVRVKQYNMSDTPPRTPVRDNTIAIGATASSTTASELCVALSFRAQLISGVNPARRRGRVFIGPLSQAAIHNTEGLLATATLTAFQTAAAQLLASSVAATGWDWSVYSQRDQVLPAVVAGHIDNAPDVQRRRGIASTTRVLF